MTCVLVYVDDIVITGPSSEACDHIRSILETKYTLGYYKDIESYLGMHITRSDSGFSLNMTARIREILSELPFKPPPLPSRQRTPRRCDWESWAGCSIGTLNENELYCLHHFAHLVGAVNYLSVTVRPDLCLAVSKSAQRLQSPTPEAAKHLYHMLRYLDVTAHRSLDITPTSRTGLAIDSDSNFADASDSVYVVHHHI